MGEVITTKSRVKTALLAAASWLAVSVAMQESAWAMSLKEALEQAYTANPVIRAEREALSATDESVARAVSEFRPDIYAEYSRGRQRLQYGNTNRVYGDRESRQIVLNQPLFDGLGSIARYKAAKYQVEAGRAQLSTVTQDVMLQAISAYVDVLRDKEVYEISKHNVEGLQKMADATQSRFDVGEVTRTDVSQAASRVSRAESDLAEAKGNLAASIAGFRRVVQAEPNVLEVQELVPPLPGTLDEAVEVALANNPVYLRSLNTEKSLNKTVRGMKAEVLPSVALQAFMRKDEGVSTLAGLDSDNDAVMLNVNIPIYRQGSEYSRVREAKQNHQRSKYQTIDAYNEVVERVTRAWENYNASIASIQANDAAISAANEALDGVKQEQLYGQRTVLDVLDAEQELYAAKINLARASRNKIVAAYSLLAEMGQLTPQNLGLEVNLYDPVEHFEDVDFKVLGW